MSSHLESRDTKGLQRPHRQWNCRPPNRCLSRKCSSSKLQLVPGQRESDMEVDQNWHLWDLMKYKGDRTLSFRLRVSKEQIPLDSGQMSFDTEIHFQPISCQYTSRKHTTSYHTEWVQVKNQFTHFTDSQQDLEPGNAKDEHEQTTKPFKKLATKTPWAATWNPGTQKAFSALIANGIAHPNRCLSRKCSSSKLQLVPGQRESDLEVDQNWHLWDLIKYKWDRTLSFRLWVSKEQTSTGFRANVVDTEMHFQPISCQYPSRKHATSYHTEWVQVKKKFTHFTRSQLRFENLEMPRMSTSKLQSLSTNWRQKQHEQPLEIPGHKRPSLLHRRWNCDPGRCLSRKCSSSKLQPVPGQRESDMEVGWNLFQKGYNSIIAKYLNKSGRPMSNSVQTTCGKNCPENQQMHILKISVRQQYLELFSKCRTGWNVAWEQWTNLCRFDWHKRKNAAEVPQVVVSRFSRSPWGKLNWKGVQSPSSSLPERSTLSPCASTQETCLKTNRCFKRASAGDLIITLLLSMPQDTEVNLASESSFQKVAQVK